MKARPLIRVNMEWVECTPEEATHLQLNMPCELPLRILPIQIKGSRRGGSNWSWNGDTENPTVKPSILSVTTNATGTVRCHSFVNDGMAIFLSDSTHDNTGQTLPLLDIQKDDNVTK